MSRLRRMLKRESDEGSSGHVWGRLSDTVYGCKSHRIKREHNFFSNDYTFIDDRVSAGTEYGADKNRHLIHSEDYFDEHKTMDYKEDRESFMDFLNDIEGES